MKRKYQILGFIILVICSVVYDFQKPEVVLEVNEEMSYVILEGEFLRQGKYEYDGQKTMQDLIDEVGISENANMNAVSLSMTLVDEARIYLPPLSTKSVSLNHASKEELMTLKGVGEKTANKIIEYRQTASFICLEDIMKVSGIGEKTYLKLRDLLCL